MRLRNKGLGRLWNRIMYKLDRGWWYLRGIVWDQFNFVKIKTLPPTWCDRDQVMLHANMQILVDFIEGEEPFRIIDWTHTRRHKAARDKMAKVYYWWKVVRPSRVDPINLVEMPTQIRTVRETRADGSPLTMSCDNDPNDPRTKPWSDACQLSWKLDELWEKEDDAMLRRLLSIRRYLWT